MSEIAILGTFITNKHNSVWNFIYATFIHITLKITFADNKTGTPLHIIAVIHNNSLKTHVIFSCHYITCNFCIITNVPIIMSHVMLLLLCYTNTCYTSYMVTE